MCWLTKRALYRTVAICTCVSACWRSCGKERRRVGEYRQQASYAKDRVPAITGLGSSRASQASPQKPRQPTQTSDGGLLSGPVGCSPTGQPKGVRLCPRPEICTFRESIQFAKYPGSMFPCQGPGIGSRAHSREGLIPQSSNGSQDPPRGLEGDCRNGEDWGRPQVSGLGLELQPHSCPGKVLHLRIANLPRETRVERKIQLLRGWGKAPHLERPEGQQGVVAWLQADLKASLRLKRASSTCDYLHPAHRLRRLSDPQPAVLPAAVSEVPTSQCMNSAMTSEKKRIQ